MLLMFITFLRHTVRSYTQYMTRKSITVAAVATGAVLVGALALNTVTARAGIEAWISSDILDEDILLADFDYVRDSDVPEDTVEGYHLQMPSSLEGYMDGGEYVSLGEDGEGSGTQKIDDQLKLTTQPSFEGSLGFELPDQDELEEATEDATEYVEHRPPVSPLS